MTSWERKAPDNWFKRGDTGPTIAATLRDGTGAVVDLTGATVKFIMWLPGATSAKVDATATVVSAVNGQVSYTWQAANLDTLGDFMAEWQATWGTTIVTFPNTDQLKIRVVDQLAA